MKILANENDINDIGRDFHYKAIQYFCFSCTTVNFQL